MKPFEDLPGELEPIRLYFVDLNGEERMNFQQKLDGLYRAAGGSGIQFTNAVNIESESEVTQELLNVPKEELDRIIIVRRREYEILMNMDMNEMPRFHLPEDLN